MDYETIDWNAEAKRVARAFGVSEECYFAEYFNDVPAQTGLGNNHLLYFLEGGESYRLPAYEGIVFWCYYDREKCSYCFENTANQHLEGIRVYSNGNWEILSDHREFYPLLAKGLFLLGFLDEGEKEYFGLEFSAHQKMEWVGEFDE